MATIEDRAKEYVLHCSTAPSNRMGRLQGYIKGATEQKQIDIDKACEWFENAVRTEFIDAYECNAEELVAMFRNVMTKEE